MVLDSYPVELYEAEDETVATCEIFPHLQGVGSDGDEALEDLADQITDALRDVVTH